MATAISSIETQARRHLNEPVASFWSSDELVAHAIAAIRDLWRSTVDLKQEHYLTIDATNVTLAANTATLTGVPSDLHKVYMLAPRDLSSASVNKGLLFKPMDYNHPAFQAALGRDPVDPSDDMVYYAVTGAGSPVAAPTIYVAPQVNSAVNLTLSYVPSLAALTAASDVPVPGEADNAVVAWVVAYARAKEREDRMPDPGWIAIYGREKDSLLQSLGVRQLQEPQIVDMVFQEYW